MSRLHWIHWCLLMLIALGCASTTASKSGHYFSTTIDSLDCTSAQHRVTWISYIDQVDCEAQSNCQTPQIGRTNTKTTNNVTTKRFCMSDTLDMFNSLQVINQQLDIKSNLFVAIQQKFSIFHGRIIKILQEDDTFYLDLYFNYYIKSGECSYTECDVVGGDRWPYTANCTGPKHLGKIISESTNEDKFTLRFNTQSNGVFRCYTQTYSNGDTSFAYLFIGPKYYASPSSVVADNASAQITCHAKSHFSSHLDSAVDKGTSTTNYTCLIQSAFTYAFLNSTFRCHHPDSRMNHERAPQEYSFSTSVASINKTSNDPNISHSCVATSFYGNQKYINVFLDMFVSFRPHIAGEEEEQLSVALSTKLHLSCQSSGVPIPKVTWFYNNQTILSCNYVTVNETELTVHWVTESGTYKCLATNGHGSVSKQFIVTVEAPSTVRPTQPETNTDSQSSTVMSLHNDIVELKQMMHFMIEQMAIMRNHLTINAPNNGSENVY